MFITTPHHRIDPMIKRIHIPSDEPGRVFFVHLVKMTLKQITHCEACCAYFGESFSAAFRRNYELTYDY